MTVSEIVQEYRNKALCGKLIDLIPLTQNDFENVVDLRNEEKNRYFMAQKQLLTVADQEKWYESYSDRNNDLYWCIFDKKKRFIGTMRLYDISLDCEILDQGSFMIYEKYAQEAPYAIEAELLSLDFAFNVLNIKSIINEDRADNKIMNNLTKKIGFTYIKDTIINGENYKYYLLNEKDYLSKRDKLAKLIERWDSR